MAHFAELNPNDVVLRVLVVDNADTADESGQEVEAIGIAFLQGLLGPETRWVQTSYNATIRGQYASPGDVYDAEADVFTTPAN
jgi:hypothetical protein